MNNFLKLLTLVLLLLSGSNVLGQPVKEKFLSDSDLGYKIIEGFQKSQCEKAPTHECYATFERCQIESRKLWSKMFDGVPRQDWINEVCRRVSTKFELPGFYILLSRIYDKVHAAALRAGVGDIKRPSLGTLPIKSVNARVIPTPDVQIILFNVRFLEFANEMAKVTLMSIPFSSEGGRIAIDTSVQAFEKRMADSPSLLADFEGAILAFLEIRNQREIIPVPIIRPLLNVYSTGIESFAMAHEYGHIALGHTNQPIALDTGDILLRGFAMESKSASALWFEELQSDVIATRIIESAFQQMLEAGETDAEPALWAFFRTPEFYFLSREIVEDARSIIETGEELAGPLDIELVMLESLKLCTVTDGCNLSEALQRGADSGPDVFDGADRHPHLTIRREVVRYLLERSPVNEDDETMLAMSQMISRNIVLMWERVRPSFLRARKDVDAINH